MAGLVGNAGGLEMVSAEGGRGEETFADAGAEKTRETEKSGTSAGGASADSVAVDISALNKDTAADDPATTTAVLHDDDDLHHGPRYAATYIEQLRVLMHRSVLIARVGIFTWQNIGLYVGLSFQAGALWFQMGSAEDDIFTKMSLCFWLVGTWTFFPMFGALPVFPSGRDALKKETSENFYRLSAYFIARTTVGIPFELIWPLLYIPIVFGMSGLGDFVTLLLVFAVLALNILMMQSVGLLVSAGVNGAQAFTVSILLITFFFGYGGLFVPLESLWPWLQWVKWLNLLTYSFHLIMQAVFRGDTTYACDAKASAYLVCVNATGTGTGVGVRAAAAATGTATAGTAAAGTATGVAAVGAMANAANGTAAVAVIRAQDILAEYQVGRE